MEKLLAGVGSFLYGMRFTMLFFYVGLVAIIFGILGKFLLETYKLMNTLLFGDLEKIALIIKVLAQSPGNPHDEDDPSPFL